MNAKERIKYFSIVNKINKNLWDEITKEDYEWLQKNPDVIKNIKMSREKIDIISKCDGASGTIEEILFVLDLSDRMRR